MTYVSTFERPHNSLTQLKYPSEKIIRIFQEELNQTVVDIVDNSNGYDHVVKIVHTNQGIFVLKIPINDPIKILREKLALQVCQEKKIPSSHIVYSSNEFLIETYISGTTLKNTEYTQQQYQEIYFMLGQLIRKFHTKKCRGFGTINHSNLTSIYNTQREYVESWFPESLSKLTALNFFSSEEVSLIKQFYEDHRYLLEHTDSVLLHGDIGDDNIIVNEQGIPILIDFGDLSAGSPMQDFAYMYISHGEDFKFNQMLAGYGEHNLDEIKFYAYLWLTWSIQLAYREYGISNILNDKITRYKNILNIDASRTLDFYQNQELSFRH